MANIKFDHSADDTLKHIYVKKDKFKKLVLLQTITTILLVISCFGLIYYYHLNSSLTKVQQCIK